MSYYLPEELIPLLKSEIFFLKTKLSAAEKAREESHQLCVNTTSMFVEAETKLADRMSRINDLKRELEECRSRINSAEITICNALYALKGGASHEEAVAILNQYK